MRVRSSRGGEHGITLVELLIVVAIVAILAAMFIARFSESRRDAAEARAVDLLDQVRKAVMAYEAKTGSFPICCPWLYWPQDWDRWVAEMERVLGDLQLPRVSQAQAVIERGMWGGGGWGYPYGIGIQARGGRGGWYLATPYQLMRCPNAPWNTSGCEVIR